MDTGSKTMKLVKHVLEIVLFVKIKIVPNFVSDVYLIQTLHNISWTLQMQELVIHVLAWKQIVSYVNLIPLLLYLLVLSVELGLSWKKMVIVILVLQFGPYVQLQVVLMMFNVLTVVLLLYVVVVQLQRTYLTILFLHPIVLLALLKFPTVVIVILT